MKRWLYWAAGGLAVLAFWILGGPERKVKKLTEQKDGLILHGTAKSKAKAKKLGEKADQHQLNAVEAEKVGRAAVDKVGTNGETVSSILDSWRSNGV